MCQLMGMNCNVPTDICFSFIGFRARGGGTDHHKDGWGIAFFEGRGVRQFLDPLPSATSPVAELVRNYPIKSTNVIAHIRRATQGAISLENTHPFMRELWGYYWIFAHNGNIPDFHPQFEGPFFPVGTTDSERIFCWLLQELRKSFGDRAPDMGRFYDRLQELCCDIGARGEFNFLLSNGEALFAHCSTRLSYVQRKSPFHLARLKDQDVTVDLSAVTTLKDCVVMLATVPLTENEEWIAMPKGSLWMFHDGNPLLQAKTVEGPVNTCTGDAVWTATGSKTSKAQSSHRDNDE